MLMNGGPLRNRSLLNYTASGRTASAPPSSSSREAIIRAVEEHALSAEDTAPSSNSTPGSADLDDENAQVAAGKVLSILFKRERGVCTVETSSVYGSALVMPQIARSSGWTRPLTHLAIRSYMFLIVNILLQASLLYLISFEEMVMDKFSGQMYLCDFGAELHGDCPGGGPRCFGPGGTEYSPTRLYDWNQWVTRNFVRESLKDIFPDRIEEITQMVDIGEYGLESYYCRLLCCFLFMLALMNDLTGSISTLSMLYHVPNEPEPWLSYEVPTWATKDYVKQVHGYSELDLVRIKVCGMPICWKVVNFLVILLPKLLLWKCTAQAGTTFLMETSGIEDLIINSIALTFILNIDEMICENFTTTATRFLMDRLEGFKLYETCDEEKMSDQQNMDLVKEERMFSKWSIRDTYALMPIRLLASVAWTIAFVWSYYSLHCKIQSDGTKVSHDMYLPVSPWYTIHNFLWASFYHQSTEEKPFWVMPHVDNASGGG